MARPKSNGSSNASSATVGFEATIVRDSAISKIEATPQVLSAAKDNMVALPGQLFHSTQIPEMFQKVA